MPPALLVLLPNDEVLRSIVPGLSPAACELALLLEHVVHYVDLARRVVGVRERPLREDVFRPQDGLVVHNAQDMPAAETEKARKSGPSPWSSDA